MSIEKFNGQMSKEESGCTIMINETIQSITDFQVLAVYVYLLSKPNSWDINAKELISHFKSCKKVIYRVLNQLISMRLLKRFEFKEKGKYLKYEYKLYLKPFIDTDESPVPHLEEPVPVPLSPLPLNGDTYKTKITSLQNKEINTTSNKKSKNEIQFTVDDILNVYHQELPNSPKIRVPTDELRRLIKKMITRWPDLKTNHLEFSLEGLANYFRYLKKHQSNFLLPYLTKNGNKAINNLENLIRFDNMARFQDGTWNFNE